MSSLSKLGSITGRNAGRGSPIYNVSAFVEHEIKLSERYRLSARAESYNLFNHSNFYGRNRVFGLGDVPVATLGPPTAGIANVDPNREFQFLFRLRF